MDTAISPADLAAIMNKNNDNYGGCWWIILLFICLFGGGFGGFGYGNSLGNNSLLGAATSADIQRAMDLQAIQGGQANISSDVQRTAYEVGNVAKDAAYNNLGEIRDVQAALSSDTAQIQSTLMSGFANQKDCCCKLQNDISSVKYEGAINTAAINANIDAKFAAMEKSQLEARLAQQENQINQLNLTTALCGIPRVSPYAYSVYPTFGNASYPFGFGTAFN